MRSIFYIFIFNILGISAFANSEAQTLNARGAEQLCEQEITRQYSRLESEIKFSRRPASSIRAGKFRFWINSIEHQDEDKESVRYLCEIEKSGEVITLTREPGRWRI